MKHCSNCGERIAGEQQFCRSCGAELVIKRPWLGFDPRILIFAGLLFTLIGAIVVLFGRFSDSKTIAFAGTIFALVSFGVTLFGAILADMPRRSRASASPLNKGQVEQPELEKADTTNRLPPRPAGDHFPTSVTEHTTTKLKQSSSRINST